MGRTLLLALGATTLLACSAAGDLATATGDNALSPAPPFGGDPANHATFAVDVSFWETPLAQSEMDCFWDSGVRHVVVGTQDEGITREQLAMAVSRGMTVDAYVYLYWNTSLAAQVDQAFQRVQGFPIGRMWLDIEQNPGTLGSNTLVPDVQQALTECQAQGQGGVACGIYTGPGFWKTYMNDTSAFTTTPLWWAEYDAMTSLSTWSTEQFGGWSSPVAKQWATKPLCGIGGADWDTMQVTATPTVTVDRSPPADTGQVPPAPGGLFPTDGYVYAYDYAKVMSETIPLATSYQLDVERWSGSAWIPYYTWTNANAFVKFNPTVKDAMYHFRVRAQNAHGWGNWSDWSSFDYGTYTGPRPAGGGSGSGGASDAGAAADSGSAVDGGAPVDSGTALDGGSSNDAGTAADSGSPSSVPTNLSPDGNVLVSTPSVTLDCSSVAGGTGYQFAIEYETSTGYAPYYTYSTTKPSQTFYPSTHGIGYRWRVRAEVGGAYGAWSPYATFSFQ